MQMEMFEAFKLFLLLAIAMACVAYYSSKETSIGARAVACVSCVIALFPIIILPDDIYSVR